ncbi:hypothetical protein Barb7_02672 [Bacteroidales bacterium Barb7]|nr:hypothetical protein Barb7_02672 [Bacteroidales bacterium Barb7]
MVAATDISFKSFVAKPEPEELTRSCWRELTVFPKRALMLCLFPSPKVLR